MISIAYLLFVYGCRRADDSFSLPRKVRLCGDGWRGAGHAVEMQPQPFCMAFRFPIQAHIAAVASGGDSEGVPLFARYRSPAAMTAEDKLSGGGDGGGLPR